MSLWKSFSRFCFYSNSLNIIKQSLKKKNDIRSASHTPAILMATRNKIHTSCKRTGLMEFFDSEKNWSEAEVLVGRSWRVEELRIKSNSDLHKLWYVLLKERNMLMTMQHEYERKCKSFPNPERLDKVEESMNNLEIVVRERNKAYFELETGVTGERPTGLSTNCFGLKCKFKMKEYLIEKKLNPKYAKERFGSYITDHKFVNNFLTRLEEKKRRIKRYSIRQQFNVACMLLRTFPHLDEDALKMQFPNIDVEAVKKDKRSLSHQENMY